MMIIQSHWSGFDGNASQRNLSLGKLKNILFWNLTKD